MDKTSGFNCDTDPVMRTIVCDDVMEHLVCAWSLFATLVEEQSDAAKEFLHATNAARNIVLVHKLMHKKQIAVGACCCDGECAKPD